MRVSFGGPGIRGDGGGGGAPAAPRVSCTILVPGDGTLVVEAGALGVAEGSSAVAIVADPTEAAPNCVRLTFLEAFSAAGYAFEGEGQGHDSAYANGELFELPASAGTRLTTSITFYAVAPNGFLDFATALVSGGNFGAPVRLSVLCG